MPQGSGQSLESPHPTPATNTNCLSFSWLRFSVKMSYKYLRTEPGTVGLPEIPGGSKLQLLAVNAIHFLVRLNTFPQVRVWLTPTNTRTHTHTFFINTTIQSAAQCSVEYTSKHALDWNILDWIKLCSILKTYGNLPQLSLFFVTSWKKWNQPDLNRGYLIFQVAARG